MSSFPQDSWIPRAITVISEGKARGDVRLGSSILPTPRFPRRRSHLPSRAFAMTTLLLLSMAGLAACAVESPHLKTIRTSSVVGSWKAQSGQEIDFTGEHGVEFNRFDLPAGGFDCNSSGAGTWGFYESLDGGDSSYTESDTAQSGNEIGISGTGQPDCQLDMLIFLQNDRLRLCQSSDGTSCDGEVFFRKVGK